MISLEDVKKARERIKDWIHETPLFSSATFSLWSGNEVYLKAENLQKSGAFKFRGAMNFMLSMDEEERKKEWLRILGKSRSGPCLRSQDFGCKGDSGSS